MPESWGQYEAEPETTDRPINRADYVRNPVAYPANNSCMHNACSECHGSGRRRDGSACPHLISCPCKRCNPISL